MAEILRGDVDEISLRGMAVLPIDRIARRIGETFEFTDCFSQHFGVVGFVNDPIVPLVFFQQRGRQSKVAEPTAALPAYSFRNTALVYVINDLLQTWDDMRVAMFAQFDHDPASTHFVRHCAGSAGASEGVENPVAGAREMTNDDLKQSLRLLPTAKLYSTLMTAISKIGSKIIEVFDG